MLLNEGHLTRWSGNYCCFFILHILPPLSLQERLIRSGQGMDGTDICSRWSLWLLVMFLFNRELVRLFGFSPRGKCEGTSGDPPQGSRLSVPCCPPLRPHHQHMLSWAGLGWAELACSVKLGCRYCCTKHTGKRNLSWKRCTDCWRTALLTAHRKPPR